MSTLPRASRAMLVAATIVLAGCGAKTINQVRADPAKYRTGNVTVKGTVDQSASVMGRGAYRITDRDQSLWVVTTGGAPRVGARVEVTGHVQDGYDLGALGRILNLPEALKNGLVLIEASHKAHD